MSKSEQHSPTPLPRRRFLQAGLAAGTLGTGLAWSGHPAAAQSSRLSSTAIPVPVEPPAGTLPFCHGVASGDPVPESVILWTRITPAEAAQPGSGQGAPTLVAWEVGRDELFRDVVKRGEVVSDPAQDHTVHIDPWGLEAATVYYFRFQVVAGPHAGSFSPTGRTRTAPPLDSEPETLNLAVASCANWESGFFSSYSDMADRAWAGELDLCVFLGDYIYEYPRGAYVGRHGPLRLHQPPHETVTLSDYRIRHGRYRTDPELQAAHGAMPWVVTWDDHETSNNSWRDGAENHSPGEGSWHERRSAARRAYFEWLPIRATSLSEEGHLYRSLRFGNLAELTMLDLRTYRDQGIYSYRAFTDPNRTIMGSEQFAWLQARIESSTTRWNILGTSVMFSPMNLGRLEGTAATSVQDLLGAQHNGIPLNADQWDGYAADRVRLLRVLVQQDATPLFLSGDIHTEWANRVMHEGHEIGVELVCSSISAPNVDEQLKLPADSELSLLAERIITDSNSHVRHVDLDAHGYSIVRVSADEVRLTWLRVDDMAVPGSPVRESIGLTWRQNQGFTS